MYKTGRWSRRMSGRKAPPEHTSGVEAGSGRQEQAGATAPAYSMPSDTWGTLPYRRPSPSGEPGAGFGAGEERSDSGRKQQQADSGRSLSTTAGRSGGRRSEPAAAAPSRGGGGGGDGRPPVVFHAQGGGCRPPDSRSMSSSQPPGNRRRRLSLFAAFSNGPTAAATAAVVIDGGHGGGKGQAEQPPLAAALPKVGHPIAPRDDSTLTLPSPPPRPGGGGGRISSRGSSPELGGYPALKGSGGGASAEAPPMNCDSLALRAVEGRDAAQEEQVEEEKDEETHGREIGYEVAREYVATTGVSGNESPMPPLYHLLEVAHRQQRQQLEQMFSTKEARMKKECDYLRRQLRLLEAVAEKYGAHNKHIGPAKPEAPDERQSSQPEQPRDAPAERRESTHTTITLTEAANGDCGESGSSRWSVSSVRGNDGGGGGGANGDRGIGDDSVNGGGCDERSDGGCNTGGGSSGEGGGGYNSAVDGGGDGRSGVGGSGVGGNSGTGIKASEGRIDGQDSDDNNKAFPADVDEPAADDENNSPARNTSAHSSNRHSSISSSKSGSRSGESKRNNGGGGGGGGAAVPLGSAAARIRAAREELSASLRDLVASGEQLRRVRVGTDRKARGHLGQTRKGADQEAWLVPRKDKAMRNDEGDAAGKARGAGATPVHAIGAAGWWKLSAHARMRILSNIKRELGDEKERTEIVAEMLAAQMPQPAEGDENHYGNSDARVATGVGGAGAGAGGEHGGNVADRHNADSTAEGGEGVDFTKCGTAVGETSKAEKGGFGAEVGAVQEKLRAVEEKLSESRAIEADAASKAAKSEGALACLRLQPHAREQQINELREMSEGHLVSAQQRRATAGLQGGKILESLLLPTPAAGKV